MPNDRARSSLFYDLFDDAAMFPPQLAPAALAVPAHSALRHGPYAEYVGPLLVAVDRWHEFASVDRDEQLAVVLIGAPTPTLWPDRTELVGCEQVWHGEPLEPGDVDSRLALEPARLSDVEALLDVVGEARIDGAPVIAKFRTGGVTADAFPSDDDLAYCILAAYNAGVPFKLTAGLHHAVRHTGATTRFEHHGFLNVMVAVARCHAGASEAGVVEALAGRDAATLADEVRGWTVDDGLRVRSSFTSFGCCGVEDPIGDLIDLRLIDADLEEDALP
ncbi:MAG TPA: hypothetical protein VLK34_03400 [Nocardioidaceae bacterium]|nr:hypothetical protein [Nocardioidaceae bacterium]